MNKSIKNSNLNKLLKNIFLSSIASLYGVECKAATEFLDNNSTLPNNNIIFSNQQKTELTKKLIIRFNSDDSYLLAGHRSHRSHNSHYSHYSSNTNSHRSHFSHYSSNTNNSTNRSTSTSSSRVNNINKTYKLGDRLIKKGASGTDVKELVIILINKNYLQSVNVDYIKTHKELEYDDIIEAAVKKFQKDNKLSIDGIVGPKTVYYLKN